MFILVRRHITPEPSLTEVGSTALPRIDDLMSWNNLAKRKIGALTELNRLTYSTPENAIVIMQARYEKTGIAPKAIPQVPASIIRESEGSVPWR